MKGLLIPVAFVVVLVGAASLAGLLGAGSASLLAGITGVVSVLALFGGTLRSDLRLWAVFGPAMVAVTTVPRVLAPDSPWMAAVVVVAVVFVAAELPAFGRRYAAVSLAVGLGVIFGYAYPLATPVGPVHLLTAAVVPVALALVIRVVAGLGDPDRPLREKLAGLFTDGDVDEALEQLERGHQQWTVQVVAAGLRFRAADAFFQARLSAAMSGTSSSDDVTEAVQSAYAQLQSRAAEVAATITAKKPSGPQRRREAPPVDTTLLLMDEALTAASAAAASRDRTPCPVLTDLARRLRSARRRRAFSWQNEQLRHALRVSLAMTAVLLLTTWDRADPLEVTLLALTYGIVQPAWSDTLTKIRQRLVGVLIGLAILAVAVWLAPQSWLLPIGLLSLLIGLTFISSRPVVYYAASVLLSVGTKAHTAGFDPIRLLVEYPILVLSAAGIGLVFGFVAVPWVRTADEGTRLHRAVSATSSLLMTACERTAPGAACHPVFGSRLAEALQAQQSLRQGPPGRRTGTESRAGARQRALVGLLALTAAALATVLRAPDHPAAARLELAGQRLEGLLSTSDPFTWDEEEHEDVGLAGDQLQRTLFAGVALVDSAAAELRAT